MLQFVMVFRALIFGAGQMGSYANKTKTLPKLRSTETLNLLILLGFKNGHAYERDETMNLS